MRRLGRIVRLGGATAVLLTLGAAGPIEHVVTGERMLAITVNGAGGRLLVDPGAPGLLLLAPDYAARAQVKSGLLGFGVSYSVGAERVGGRTGVARVALDGGGAEKRRIGWAPRAYLPRVDAVVGPSGVDAPVVRFQLRAAVAGERSVALEMAPVGGLFAGWFGSYARIAVGDATMLVRFDINHRRTLATATAARVLASANGGRLTGAASTQDIAFGIARPIRTMTLARPLAIGPLTLDELAVRTADTGSVASIPEVADASVGTADPDEVVVVAKGAKQRPGRIVLGSDQLARCSSIVFDKPARRIVLTCR